MRALMRALARAPAHAFAQPAQDRLDRRRIADVFAERPLVGDAADGLALRIVLGERGALAAERARAVSLHAALDRRRPRAEDRAQLVDGRVGDGAQRLVAGRVQLALGDGADAGKRAHRQRRQHGALDARRHQHHAARLGQRGRHLRHHLAGGDAGARGQPQLAVDRARELQHRALDRGVAVVVTGAPVQALAAGEVEEHLVDAGDQHGRRVAPGDVAHALRVAAVGVAAGRQIDGVRRQLPRLDQRHARTSRPAGAPRSSPRSPRRACRAGRPRRRACPRAWDRGRARPRRRTCRGPGNRSGAAPAAPIAQAPPPSTCDLTTTVAVRLFSIKAGRRDTLRHRDEDRHLERELAARAAATR